MKTFCQKCGEQTKKYEMICHKCGEKLKLPNIPNYAVLSIIVIFFFFPLTGIVSLIYSLKVDNKIKEGNFEEAVKASKKALIWSCVTIVVVVIIIALDIYFETLK